MPRHKLLVLIFLMALKCVKSDITLNKFKSELGDWSKSMPKVWFSYIRMHLFKYLEKYMKKSQCVNSILWDRYIVTRTKWFVNIGKMTTLIYISFDRRMRCIEKIEKKAGERCIMNQSRLHWNLSYPVGQFAFHNYMSGFWTDHRILHWNLNPRLRLNITFFKIDLSFCGKCLHEWCAPWCPLFLVHGVPSMCYSYLPIGEGEQRYIYTHTVQHRYIQFYEFCGQYSTFSFYSKHNMVNMCVYRLHQCVEHRVVGMFMTTGGNKVFNEPILGKGVRPYSIYSIKKKFILYRYFVTVKILHKIILTINDLKHTDIWYLMVQVCCLIL